MLYHVSRQRGIKVLEPRVSSHEKAYVYAISNIVTALLFGARHDDFDFLIDEDENGRTVIYECYPKALEKIFCGKSCFVYEVEEEGFLRGVTSWEPELVCENAVKVVRETTVDDLYQRLLLEEEQGNLRICHYSEEIEYRKLISEHIVDRMIRFDVLDRLETDERFQTYYRKLIEGLLAVMDGHLL